MGFKSPLFLLGLGLGSPAVIQGGFRTPLPGWNAGATTAVIQGGFLTPLPFLFGGAGIDQIEDPKVHPHIRFHQQIMQEDEELLIIARSFIEILRWRR